MADRQIYRLGEASRILDVCVDTLRRYEMLGYVTFQRVNGQRIVTAAQINAIRARRATFRLWRGKEKLSRTATAVEV